jgi:hypothetical protein
MRRSKHESERRMTDAPPAPPPTWEHRSILVAIGKSRAMAREAAGEPVATLDDALNEQAGDGWELVSVLPALAAGENASGIAHVLAVFRRHPR